jgi:hypothetical protein
VEHPRILMNQTLQRFSTHFLHHQLVSISEELRQYQESDFEKQTKISFDIEKSLCDLKNKQKSLSKIAIEKSLATQSLRDFNNYNQHFFTVIDKFRHFS